MKIQQSDALEHNLGLLREIARQLKVRTRALNLHDFQVARSPFHWQEALQDESVVPPDRFVRQLNCVIDGNRTVLRVNDEYIVIEMNGPFGGNIICSFNQKNAVLGLEHFGTAKLAPAALVAPYDWRVFLFDDKVSRDAVSLLKKPAVSKCVEELHLGPEESLHILQGQVILYLRRYESKEVLDALKALTMFVDSLPKVRQKPIDLKALPQEFHPLIPLIERWGITDDEKRSELLARASRVTRSCLVNQVAPYFGAINLFLNGFENNPLPEHASRLGALAECASEVINSAER